jgi:hypothetical protein
VKKLLVILAAVVLLLALVLCNFEFPADNGAMDAEYEPVDGSATESDPPTCPITDEEIVMLAKTMYAESQVVYWDGTKWGVSYTARQAAVGWCALNRYDDGGYGDTLAEVLTKPNAFAYREDTEASEYMMRLAEDVVDRWWEERQGAQDVGRTLPVDYLFFDGDGRENYFRKEYERTEEVWDWSLPDPYQ